MIRGIGEVLRLETESVAAFVDMPILPGYAAIQKIASVKLNTGLGR